MILRDPVHGLVSFEQPPFELVPKLLQTRELQRLRRIRQLGLASLVYPGAEHTRFAHAVGSAYVMTRFVARLQELHGELPSSQRMSPDLARDAVVGALLHDVGHGPLSHLFEDAIVGGPRHEQWTRRILQDPTTEVHQTLVEADRELPERACELIEGRHKLAYLSATVSGMVDVDRCDYLLRDAHSTGVNYGHFDLDWLLRSLRLGPPSLSDCAPPLAIDGARGLPAVESFVLARLFMFQQVYFHKAGRAGEWHVGRILARLKALLDKGHRVTPLPLAIEHLLTERDAPLHDYLELDDGVLWNCFTAWRQSGDSVLADLCHRLCTRRLFKTLELFGDDLEGERYAALLRTAQELASEAGLDPDYYVGLDEASLVPYDNSRDPLRVVFPDGSVRAPEAVSFLLGRLCGERLSRVRLVYPEALREGLQRRMPGGARSEAPASLADALDGRHPFST